ncbi:intron-binding protein aquarius-like, partial [Trifolium medium]|nr:intron-binding protein aquarius-like [Trifolium medium]
VRPIVPPTPSKFIRKLEFNLWLKISLEDEVVSMTVLRLASLKSWYSLSYGRFQMELCLNPGLVKKWKRMLKKEPVKGGQLLDPSTTVEVKFLRNLIEEFLEVVIC